MSFSPVFPEETRVGIGRNLQKTREGTRILLDWRGFLAFYFAIWLLCPGDQTMHVRFISTLTLDDEGMFAAQSS